MALNHARMPVPPLRQFVKESLTSSSKTSYFFTLSARRDSREILRFFNYHHGGGVLMCMADADMNSIHSQ